MMVKAFENDLFPSNEQYIFCFLPVGCKVEIPEYR